MRHHQQLCRVNPAQPHKKGTKDMIEYFLASMLVQGLNAVAWFGFMTIAVGVIWLIGRLVGEK